MTRLTVEQDMKLGSALDQLEDAIEAMHTSIKMVKWAQLNVSRFVGGILGPEVGARIRAVPFDADELWELTQISRRANVDQGRLLSEFIENHNQKILTVILSHPEKAE